MTGLSAAPILAFLSLAVLPVLAQENPWSDPPGLPVPPVPGLAIVATDADTLYVAPGGRAELHRYTISAQSWWTLPAPAGLSPDGGMTQRTGTPFIYLFPGTEAGDFHEYDAAAGSWKTLASIPIALVSGVKTRLVATAAKVYALYQNTYWEFTPDPAGPGAWTSKAYPFVHSLNCVTYPGQGDFIYGRLTDAELLAGVGHTFVRYSIGDNEWTSLHSDPAVAAEETLPHGPRAAALLVPGPGDTLVYVSYYRTGYRSRKFHYDIALKAWSEPPGSSMLQHDVLAVAPGGGDAVFFVRPDHLLLQRYSIATNSILLPALEQPTISSAFDSAMVGVGDGNHLYGLDGSGRHEAGVFVRFSISGGGWTGRQTFPTWVGPGASLVHDGGDFIYATAGAHISQNASRFLRYSISLDAPWEEMEGLPKRVKVGTKLVGVGGTHLYAIFGEGTSELYRYTLPGGAPSGGTWDQVGVLPDGALFSTGMNMAYPGSGDLLYFMQGGGRSFRSYSLSTGTWDDLADLLDDPGQGASLCSPSGRETIYAFRGAGWPTLWAYSIPGNAWISKVHAPDAPKLNQALVHPGGGSSTLYALAGMFCSYAIPNEPPVMSPPGQFRLDGTTPISPGASTNEGSFVVVAAAADPEHGTVHLEVEAKRAGLAFNGQPATTHPRPGSPLSVSVSGLTVGLAYHWRVRATDDKGLSSDWMTFGPAAGTDLSLVPNSLPSAASIRQLRPSDRSVIEAGKACTEGSVRFQADLSDPDPDRIRFEVEIRPAGAPFQDVATATSAALAGGQTAGVVVGLPSGYYCWQYRTLDALEAGSGWIAFGGNPADEADFVLESAGSEGGTFGCAQSASGRGMPGLLCLAMAGLLLRVVLKSARRASSGLLILAVGCGAAGGSGGGGGDSTPGPVIRRLRIDPPASALVEGESVVVSAILNVNGVDETVNVTWASSAQGVAAIDASGTIRAVDGGAATIIARWTDDPTFVATASISVAPMTVVGFDVHEGFVGFPGDGSRRIPLPLVEAGGGSFDSGLCSGFVTSPLGSYLILWNALWQFDPETREAAFVADFPPGPYGPGLVQSPVVDSRGRVYGLDHATYMIVRYDPADGSFRPFAPIPATLPTGLLIDSADALYVQDFLTSLHWVHRIDSDGTVRPIVDTPEALPSSLGLCFGPTKDLLYVAGRTVVYRCKEVGIPDGDFLDPGERVEWAAGFGSIVSLCRTPDGVLVNDDDAGAVVRLDDRNGDGDLLDPGERVVWTLPGVKNAYFSPSIQAR